MRPFKPKLLPLKKIEWEKFGKLLERAHKEIGKGRGKGKEREARASLYAQREDPLQIADYKKALKEGERFLQKKPISEALLKLLHKNIKAHSGKNKKEIGHYRKRQNWIGPEGCTEEEAFYLPPKYTLINEYMVNLIVYAKGKEKDPLIQLAIIFAQFLSIHPFMDGNGRVMRAFIPLFLWKKHLTKKPNFYMSAYFKKHRDEYYNRLFFLTQKGDWTGWFRFFLKGIIASSKS